MPKSVEIYKSKSNYKFDEMINLLNQCCQLDKKLNVILHSRSNNSNHLSELTDKLNLNIVSSYIFSTIKQTSDFENFYSTPGLFKWGTFRTPTFSDPEKQGFEIDINRVKPKIHMKLGLPYNNISKSIESATKFISKSNKELCLGFRDNEQISESIESLITANHNLRYRDASWEFNQGSNRYLAVLSPRKIFNDSQIEVHRTASVSIIFRDPIIQFINQETYGENEIRQLINHYNPQEIQFHCTSVNPTIFKVLSNSNCKLNQNETEYNINRYLQKDTEKLKTILDAEENCYISFSFAKIFSNKWNTNMDFVKNPDNTWIPEFEIDIDGDENYKNSVRNLIDRDLIYDRSE